MFKKIAAVAITFALPALVLAQTSGLNTGGLENSVRKLIGVANLLVPLLLAIALIFFGYGVIAYILAAGPVDKQKARDYMIYGILGITAILAVYGIAAALINLFGISTGPLNTFPQVTGGTTVTR